MSSAARSVVLSRGAAALQRPAARTLSTTRSLAAKKKASPSPRPLILEKPLKFNPPSHGARLPKKRSMPQHYGGPLSEQERQAQSRKDYPTMMAPQGTWAHWFWTNRLIHVYITTGTLLILGIATYFMNFCHTSPFKDLAPPVSDAFSQPLTFARTWMSVLGMHYRDANLKAAESRSRKLDDVLKRQAFQSAHGTEKGPMEKYFGFGRAVPEEEEQEAKEKQASEESQPAEEQKPKKRFGIF